MADIAGDVRRQRGQVGVEVGVVGALLDGRSHPPIPFERHDQDETDDHEQDRDPYAGAGPGKGAERRHRPEGRRDDRLAVRTSLGKGLRTSFNVADAMNPVGRPLAMWRDDWSPDAKHRK